MDLEAEYNNRARVPEHPAIFERWKDEAEAYRRERGLDRRAYGPAARQTIDLFRPDAATEAPVALFVHGGYWRSLGPDLFSHMARGLNARGMVVGVAGYDLCPQVSIATIVDQIRQACVYLWNRYERRILVYGHSAGGHLAACMLATDWSTHAPDLPDDLVPAAYSISGLFDLSPLTEISMNEDLKLDMAEARRVSPVFWPVQTPRTFDAVVGALESSEFLRQSRMIAEAWAKAGLATRYEELAGANHFTAIDPLADADSAMVERLVELAALTQGRR